MSISEAKIAMVSGVFAASPDDVLRRLESVLAGARAADPSLDALYALAAAESGRRVAIATVFAPILPLTAMPSAIGPVLRPKMLRAAWKDVADADPDLAARAIVAARSYWDVESPPAEFDIVCRRAAEFAGDPGLVRLLRLCPLLRAVQPRLCEWVHNLSGEHVAAVRLAFKDALTLDADAGRLFWDAVMALLPSPWQVIRLISAATDRPSDRYLAESELAGIGERILDAIDLSLGGLKRFDPSHGEEAGAAAASALLVAIQEIAEFEEWLTLRKDGPWGQRIVDQKMALSLAMEARLREMEPAVAAALPTQAGRGIGKALRPSPKLTADPQPLLVTRARAFLTLLEEARAAAGPGGFASARMKVMEALDKRLDQYCEDLLDVLHKREIEELDRARAYLDIAADFIGLIKGPSAAQIIRRRTVAA
jgi:hypothetical protein